MNSIMENEAEAYDNGSIDLLSAAEVLRSSRAERVVLPPLV